MSHQILISSHVSVVSQNERVRPVNHFYFQLLSFSVFQIYVKPAAAGSPM